VPALGNPAGRKSRLTAPSRVALTQHNKSDTNTIANSDWRFNTVEWFTSELVRSTENPGGACRVAHPVIVFVANHADLAAQDHLGHRQKVKATNTDRACPFISSNCQGCGGAEFGMLDRIEDLVSLLQRELFDARDDRDLGRQRQKSFSIRASDVRNGF